MGRLMGCLQDLNKDLQDFVQEERQVTSGLADDMRVLGGRQIWRDGWAQDLPGGTRENLGLKMGYPEKSAGESA